MRLTLVEEHAMPLWTLSIPIVAGAVLLLSMLVAAGPWLALLYAATLIGAVIASVHHAEVIAHRVGEPLGTLVLAVAITVIEVALIVSMMISGQPAKADLPRDTVFSAIMIICNGVMGLCLLAGGLRHHEQSFRIEGASAALSCLIALTTLSLVLPAFTTSAPGPMYSGPQLAFAGVASLVLWLVFVFVQTVRHRNYFLPAGDNLDENAQASPPSPALAWASFALLLVSLVAVVGLAKALAPTLERALATLGAPNKFIGIIIALLVLLPETWAALRSARANRLQNSLNLALGSALASIGLTIPAVAVASVWLDIPLVLGIDPKDLVLLMLTFIVSTITLASGRTNILQGSVHLVLFAAFLFLAFVP
jgi:Ca2+:H+ antiporter